MTNHRKYIALAFLAATTLTAGCELVPGLSPAVVITHEDNVEEVQVDRPQRLDVVMNDTEGWQERCDHMGGTPNEAGRVCENVDY